MKQNTTYEKIVFKMKIFSPEDLNVFIISKMKIIIL